MNARARKQTTFAVYRGATFVRYMKATTRAEALECARLVFGPDADAVGNGPAFAPGSGQDRFGFYTWDAPSCDVVAGGAA